jgi:hypothetical protein
MKLINQITPIVVTYNSADLYNRLFETLSIFKRFITTIAFKFELGYLVAFKFITFLKAGRTFSFPAFFF